MHMNLNENAGEFIDKKIKSGEFRSAEEVVHAAINRWAVDEMEFEPGEIDALLKPALEQMKRGEGIPFDEAMDRLDQRIQEASKKRLGA